VAPFFGSATELLGGDPGRLHPFAQSRKLVEVGADGLAHATHLDRAAIAAAVRSHVAHPERPERLVPIGVCALLVAAAALSSLPAVGTAKGGAAPTYGPRVVIAGLDNSGATSAGTGTEGTGNGTGNDGTTGSYLAPAPTDSLAGTGLAYYDGEVTIPNTLAGPEVGSGGQGVFATYTVVAGDTLVAIAKKFDVGLTTLYWANSKSLPDPEALHLGQHLSIPPIDGLVVVISAADTIDSLATKYKVDAQAIVDANKLAGTNIVSGDTLLIPGASGGAMPVPKSTTGGSGGSGGSGSWTGGRLLWPVRGTISQYFHSGHPAIDIAAHSGTPVVAAAAGTVIYAGWKTTGGGVGGGIVVWISHGGGLYTTYNHLSAEIPRVGQRVSAGQRIGYVGMTGVATGPHLHFEVWVTLPWGDWTTSGARNPMAFLGR
jgi:murein DD-endopeptidase MepM/ murein hydrolase activator NlpD